MHIAKVPNRNARPSFLLRETYREDGKVKNRTLANLSKLPVERIETLRAALRGDPLAPIGETGFEIRRSLPHGHVLAALATARRIGLNDLLPRRAPQRRRDLALGLIVALCANDDETLTPFEFRLGHRRTTSWLCPTHMAQSHCRMLLTLKKAASRHRCRHRPPHRPNFRHSPGGGRSLRRPSCASWRRPTAPPIPAGSPPFCVARAFTRQP
jgi:hypothetical protein